MVAAIETTYCFLNSSMKNSYVILSVGKRHPEVVRSQTLNFPLVCSAFVEAFSQFF